MEAFGQIQGLISQGRFATALAEIERLPLIRSRTLQAETLRLEVLERTGNYAAAESIAVSLLRNKALGAGQRSVCEFSLGLVLWEKGQTQAAIEHFNRAVSQGTDGGDLWRTCWAQLRLLVSLSGQSTGQAASRLLAEVRQNVVRLGDPVVSAALHVFLGEIEAKRGLLAISNRHTRLGQGLLKKSQNIWLEALAENNLAAVAIMRFELESGLSHAERALKLSRESGAAAMIRAALANLGNLHYLRGDFASARSLLTQSYELLPSSGEHANGSLDSLARTHIAEGLFDEADALLSRIEGSLTSAPDRELYSGRHAMLTRIEYLMRMGCWSEALPLAETLLGIVNRVGDRALEATVYARYAEIAAVASGPAAAIPFFNSLANLLVSDCSPSHLALYETAIGETLARAGDHSHVSHHLNRAARIYRTLGCGIGLVGRPNDWELDCGALTPDAPSEGALVQDIAALLMHAGRHELVATGLIDILKHANCIVSARAVSRAADNTEDVLDEWGAVTDASAVRTYPIGTSRERVVEIQLQPLPDIESQATANSVGFLIASGQELERAQIAREERLTLWPVDELPAEDDDSVVAGKMREVMIFARKIAHSNAAVLLTGESGTGKEVLARALHRYSARSKRPFVPFNCTAVPRDLLESHLFGFKRGAFTGADRDNPGIIRSARDGTLFLDEIGELGLDLQPKLLRFLESGEIQPLGETAPCLVNVRIVAATNADLKKLVEQGRFREDLYYRLNVIPIEIPPLRERREEIAPLAQHFALKWSHDLGKGCIRVAEDLMEHLKLYPWPGNIRQLSNEINRMIATADADAPLSLAQFPRELREQTEQLKRRASGFEMAVPLSDTLEHAVSALEREMIGLALRLHNGRVEAAAKALGISRKGLYLKRRRLGL